MASGSGTPAANRAPRTAADRPTIDSTDRSISPAMMIRAIGSDMIATSITAAIRFAKFRPLRNTGDTAAPIAISATRNDGEQDLPARQPAEDAADAGHGRAPPGDRPLELADEHRIEGDRDQDHEPVQGLQPELREAQRGSGRSR